MALVEDKRLVDLSHVIEDGMVTYKGLPGPHICDFWTREGSAANYDDGSTFQIGKIELVANTGTYLDSPFHRYADGADLSELDLRSLADVTGIVVRSPWENGLTIGSEAFAGRDVAGKAVLVHTGWDRHWRTDAYFGEHPYLTAAAADWLAEQGAVIVGIDSVNIDDAHSGGERPAHSILLGAGVPVLEHLTGLARVPDRGARLHAVPARVREFGTFPVRAYAVVPH